MANLETIGGQIRLFSLEGDAPTTHENLILQLYRQTLAAADLSLDTDNEGFGEQVAAWKVGAENGTFLLDTSAAAIEPEFGLVLCLLQYETDPSDPNTIVGNPSDFDINRVIATHPMVFIPREEETQILIDGPGSTLVDPEVDVPSFGFELSKTTDPTGKFDDVIDDCSTALQVISGIAAASWRKHLPNVGNTPQAILLAAQSVYDRADRPMPTAIPGQPANAAFDRIYSVCNAFDQTQLQRVGFRVKQFQLLADARKCELKSWGADKVSVVVPLANGFSLPVAVAVSQEDDFNFAVPLAYFYSTAFEQFIGPENDAEKRYADSVKKTETDLKDQFESAKTADLLGEAEYELINTSHDELAAQTLTGPQAARRLWMLRESDEEYGTFSVPTGMENTFEALLVAYRDESDPPDASFWGANADRQACHYHLAAHVIAIGHDPLNTAIKTHVTSATPSFASLEKLTDKDWVSLIENNVGLIEANIPDSLKEFEGSILNPDATKVTYLRHIRALVQGPPPTPPTPVQPIPLIAQVTVAGGAELTHNSTLKIGDETFVFADQISGAAIPDATFQQVVYDSTPGAETSPDAVATELATVLTANGINATASGAVVVFASRQPVVLGGTITGIKLLPKLFSSSLDVSATLEKFLGLAVGFTFVDAVLDLTPFDSQLDLASDNDSDTRVLLEKQLQQLNMLFRFASVVGVSALQRVSVIEGLYSRGFVDPCAIAALTTEQFRVATAGMNIATAVDAIHVKAVAICATNLPPSSTAGFNPVNSAGLLTNCFAPEFQTVLGRPAYLHDLLAMMPHGAGTLGVLLKPRRGDIGLLSVTEENFAVELPAIDLVNETFESLVEQANPVNGNIPFDTEPAIYETTVTGDMLRSVPQHSTPNVSSSPKYGLLKDNFESPDLPYEQPLDVVRSYAEMLDTCRFEAMLTTRVAVTEFVHAPDATIAGFDEHLRRYPVKLDIAREYIKLSKIEHDTLFTTDLIDIHKFYGFDDPTNWLNKVAKLTELLSRLGLEYWELVELVDNGLVALNFVVDPTATPPVAVPLPPEFPCNPSGFNLHGHDSKTMEQLLVTVRLYRVIQRTREISFPELKLFVDQLALYLPVPHPSPPPATVPQINPDFIRQLCALLMLCRDFDLSITEGIELLTAATPAEQQATRERLALAIQAVAKARRNKCDCAIDRNEEIQVSDFAHVALLAGLMSTARPSLDAALGQALDDAFEKPTHLLRFAEVCLKVATSDFTVEELVFLFVNQRLAIPAHKDLFKRDNPFALPSPPPPANPSVEASFDLPWTSGKNHEFSLKALRSQLVEAWQTFDDSCLPDNASWSEVELEFQCVWSEVYNEIDSPTPLHEITQGPLEALARLVQEHCEGNETYCVPLAGSMVECWEKYPPFNYEPDRQLNAYRPVRDVDAIDWLADHDSTDEDQEKLDRAAVKTLHSMAREDIFTLRWLFPNFKEAVEHLIENPCEHSRCRFVLKSLRIFKRSLRVIVCHLAGHVTGHDIFTDGCPTPVKETLACTIRSLLTQLVNEDHEAAKNPLDSLTVLLGLRGNGLTQIIGNFPRKVNRPMLPAKSFNALNDPAKEGIFVDNVDDLSFPACNSHDLEASWSRNVPLYGTVPKFDFPPGTDDADDLELTNGFTAAKQNAQPYFVAWKGLLYIDESQFVRFACDLGVNSDAGCSVTIGTPTPISFEQWGDDNGGSKAIRFVEQPIHEVQKIAAGFYDIEVVFYDRTIDCDHDFTSSFSLLKAVAKTHEELSDVGCDGYVEVHSSEYYQSTKWEMIRPDDNPDLRDTSGFVYRSSVRDIRRTYQRVLKWLIFAYRLRLTHEEIQYFSANSTDFGGESFDANPTHRGTSVSFSPNTIPVGDPYLPAKPPQVTRQEPSVHESAAWLDLWERMFDYVGVRDSVWEVRSKSWFDFWRIFADATKNVALPTLLQKYMNVESGHVSTVTKYLEWNDQTRSDDDSDLQSSDFTSTDWLRRVRDYDQWIHGIEDCSAMLGDVVEADELWQFGAKNANHVNMLAFVNSVGPNANFNHESLRQTNDELRVRGRDALIAYLCSMKRFPISQNAAATAANGWARRPHDLSDRLLMDVHIPVDAQISRIESAVHSAESYLRRARIGSRIGANQELSLSPDAARLLSGHFASYQTWRNNALRNLYPENYADIEAYLTSSGDRAFQILAKRLREDTLTRPEEFSGDPSRALLDLVEQRPPATSGSLVNHGNKYDRILVTDRTPTEVHLTSFEDSKTGSNLIPLWRQRTSEVENPFVQVQGSIGRADEFFFWLELKDEYRQDPPFSRQEEPWTHLPDIDFNDFIRLRWRKLSHGIERQARVSVEGIRLDTNNGAMPQKLELHGRNEDAIFLEFDNPTNSIFRYDIASDSVSIVVAPVVPSTAYGGLSAFPHFVSDPLPSLMEVPPWYAPANLIADHLLFHRQYSHAAEWLKYLFDPTVQDCDWLQTLDERTSLERATILKFLELVLDWADDTADEVQRDQLIELVDHVLGPEPNCASVVPSPFTVASGTFERAPLNPRLMALWQQLCSDSGIDCNQSCSEDYWITPDSDFRFTNLVVRAKELCVDLQDLGGKLQSAYERGDAEYLSNLRILHESQLLELTLEIRQHQWREADWQLQALHKTLEMAQLRERHFQHLINTDRHPLEDDHTDKLETSRDFYLVAAGAELAGSIATKDPDEFEGEITSGQAAGTFEFKKTGGGEKSSAIQTFLAAAARAKASYDATDSALDAANASYFRRREEWDHQLAHVKIEIEQIKRLIRAAERRRDIALRELNNHQQQMVNSRNLVHFSQNKFSNHDLFTWLCNETSALYRQLYNLAIDTAKDAERAFHYEVDFNTNSVVDTDGWGDIREGLLAGERLKLSIQQMDRAFRRHRIRDFDVRKDFSLREAFAKEFLQLRLTGSCEIEIPEWQYDLDYPNQYMRRLKQVSLTIPAVVGPFQSVNCTLTQLNSSVKTNPSYQKDQCCVKTLASTSSIATSSAQDDSGRFQLNFQDERYLPFEGAGASGRWKIDLSQEYNRFDLASVSDVILRLGYTSKQTDECGADATFRDAKEKELAQLKYLLLDVRRDFPDSWARLVNCQKSCGLKLSLPISRNLFPWFTHRYSLEIESLVVVYLSKGSCNELVESNVKFCPTQKKKFAYSSIHHEDSNAYIGRVDCPEVQVDELDSFEFELPRIHYSDVFVLVEYRLIEKEVMCIDDCKQSC